MIQEDKLYKPSLNYIKKERFTGSYCGMRYLLEKKSSEDEEDKILACVWPEPFCYDKTEETMRESKEFPFSQDGLEQAWEWFGNKQESFQTS